MMIGVGVCGSGISAAGMLKVSLSSPFHTQPSDISHDGESQKREKAKI
jgi:hypothetical protein